MPDQSQYYAMDTRARAIDFIQPYVERGDSLAALLRGEMGRSTLAIEGKTIQYDIQIGRDILWGYFARTGADVSWLERHNWHHRLRVRHHEIGVVLDDRITGVYKVAALYEEIRSGIHQPTLFDAALFEASGVEVAS